MRNQKQFVFLNWVRVATPWTVGLAPQFSQLTICMIFLSVSSGLPGCASVGEDALSAAVTGCPMTNTELSSSLRVKLGEEEEL